VASHVLFVEDDPQIQHVLSLALIDDGFEVTGAATGEEGVALAETTTFDLAIIDLRLPGMTGFDVVSALRKRSDMPLVILTAHGDSHDVVAGLEAGADDFLSKPIAAKELTARLRAILRRSSSMAPSNGSVALVKVGALEIRPASHEALLNGVPLSLTRTEFGVLQELATRSPATVSRLDLLEAVWGYDYLGDSRLVDMQIYRLRQKLDALGLRDAIVTIRGVGFQLVG
jgi:two-component system response regulator MtrA